MHIESMGGSGGYLALVGIVALNQQFIYLKGFSLRAWHPADSKLGLR